MISAAKRTALSAASFLSAMTLLGTPSFAIDGGSVAGRDRLSQATVGIGTLVAGSDRVSLSRCSGVLISRDLVLTAAHCVRTSHSLRQSCFTKVQSRSVQQFPFGPLEGTRSPHPTCPPNTRDFLNCHSTPPSCNLPHLCAVMNQSASVEARNRHLDCASRARASLKRLSVY